MNLRLTEEQTLIEASVRSLLDGEYSFAQRQRSIEAPDGCRSELWAKFADMGWLALPLSEEAGGLGGGALETGLLMRAFGRHLVVEPYLACAVLAGSVVASMGRPDQVSAWLPGLMKGKSRLAVANEEAGQRNPWERAKTSAVRRGEKWELRGAKRLARGVLGADALLVTATEVAPGAAPEQERVFLVSPGTPGLNIQAARCTDGAHAADLQLDGVLVPGGNLLDAGSPEAVHAVLARSIVALCWEAVGAMTAALEMTVGYAHQRVQFGRALIQFQVVEHRLAEMAVCCEESLAACEMAALRLDRGDADVAGLASMVKAKVGRCARFVAQQAVQLHGAMGVTEELPIASYFRRLMAFTLQYGATDWHAQAFAEGQLRGSGWRYSRTLPMDGERAGEVA